MLKEIQMLMEHIEDELDDACGYIKEALALKPIDMETANLYYKLSTEEMNHMDLLHKRVVYHLDKYKLENGAPPVAMKAVYDHLHKKYIERAEKVTNLQNMFRK